MASEFYRFLTGFLDTYPEFKGRDILITGESYAGYYIPTITSYIMKQNNTDIVIKGLAIGNGWVDPYYQFPAIGQYLFLKNMLTP